MQALDLVLPFGEAVFWGVVTFSLLVFLHEGGHFLAARAFGVKVHEFMLGLPGPAIRFRTKSTTLGITAIPLGGYVRIAGMEPGAEDDMLAEALGTCVDAGRIDTPSLAEAIGVPRERAAAMLATLADYGALEAATDDEVSYLARVERGPGETSGALLDRVRARTYRGKKTWQRISILAAGVVVNFVAAVLTFVVVLSLFGYPTPTLKIAEVVPSSAAAAAGLRAGDRLVAVDTRRLKDWPDFQKVMRNTKPGRHVTVAVVRNGRLRIVSAVLGDRDGMAFLGVGPDQVNVPVPPARAVSDSLKLTGTVFVSILKFFGNVIHPAKFVASLKDARSIVGVSEMAVEAVKSGPLDYAVLVALLSVVLGSMNILPIPPLDGGKVFLELVERVIGRPIRRQVSLGISAAGAVLLFSLIGYLMYADIARIVAGG